MVWCVVGVCNAESILTMPVVTTLFRNLFDIIFTIFYGCRTVFNGVGPLLTLPAPFDVRFIWLIRFWTVHTLADRDSLSEPSCPLCYTMYVLLCPGRLCSMLLCWCVLCALCVCALCWCAGVCVCPLRGFDCVGVTFW